MIPDLDPAVAAVFDTYPAAARARLMTLRALIFETAASIDGVGPITETLKWGEPAYLTNVSKTGSTIRLGWKKAAPTRCALSFHCGTDLVDRFRTMFPDVLQFEGNRAVVLGEADETPIGELAICIAAALTYHRDKKAARVA